MSVPRGHRDGRHRCVRSGRGCDYHRNCAVLPGLGDVRHQHQRLQNRPLVLGKNDGLELYMRDWLTIPLFLVAYVVLTQWLLPKLGVPT